MHRGKVDPGVSELPRGNELSRVHVNRPLVKFKDYHIKEKIICSGKCDLNSISLKDNSNSNAFNGIQLVQDNFIKFTLNLPKNCWGYFTSSLLKNFNIHVCMIRSENDLKTHA